MKWLDRVKACDPFDPENRRKVYAKLSGTEGDVVLKVMERSWRQLEVARFLEIVNLCERSCMCRDYYQDEHGPSCPFSDEWGNQ